LIEAGKVTPVINRTYPLSDYLQEDFTKNGKTYDAIIDAVGKYSFVRSRH